jgi:hypothetical protein
MAKVEDDEFKAAARQADAEEKARQAERKARAAGGGFEKIKWTGVSQTPGMLILRFLGKKPDLHYGTTIPTITPIDARVVNLARVIADNGKQMEVVLPLYDRDYNHIMWRIYDRINTIAWVEVKDDKDPTKKKTEKFYVNRTKYPEIFNIINYNGLNENDPQRKFGLQGKGWKGKEVLIVNVIDRALYDWHHANKHSVLLAKKITNKTYADGTQNEFVEKGVPAYGLSGPLTKIRMVYGDWEQYDIAFERTGLKETPGEAFNASKNPEKVLDETLQALISSEPLTEEEASWEKYDLDHLFSPSTYTKLWNRLHLTIERIDAQLGTFYADELKKLADEEVTSKMSTGTDTETETDTETDTETEEQEESIEPKPEVAKVEKEAPLQRAVKPKASLSIGDLPGFRSLTEKERGLIASVISVPESGKRDYKLAFKEGASKREGPCPECDTIATEDFDHCPGCGVSFLY